MMTDPGVESSIERAKRRRYFIYNFVWTLVLASVSLYCATEIDAREEYLISITNASESESSDVSQQGRLEEIKTLINVGTNAEDNTLRAILGQQTGESEVEISTKNWIPFILGFFSTLFEYASSDRLFALSLICASLVGALAASLRNSAPIPFPEMAISVATGFAIFVLIKGGTHLYVGQLKGATSTLNPYSSIAIAFLAGLFSERFYRALAGLAQNREENSEKSQNASRDDVSKSDT